MREEKSTSVKREIVINVPVEKVWNALVIPSERNKWETNNCEMDLRMGGVVQFDYGWGVSYTAIIEELIENKKLVFKGEDGHLTRWLVEPVTNGTKVSVEYTGMWIGDLGHMEMDNMAFGTYQFMRNLKTVLEESKDIRHTFWKSWVGALHRTNREGSVQAAKIVEIISDTPSDGVLKPGDLVITANGHKIQTYDDLEILVTEMGPEQKIELEIIRNEEKRNLHLTTISYGQKLVK